MDRPSTDDLKANLGASIRRLRISAQLTQSDLARRSDLAPATIAGLERGSGSITSLVRALRALDSTEWLDDLAPEVEMSPMQLLREARGKSPQRQRVRTPQKE